LEGEHSACLISGCSHRGIEPIFRHAAGLTQLPLRYVVGGTHLDGAADHKLEAAAEFLRSTGAELYFGHCTGMNGYARLYALLGSQLSPLGTGLELDFDL